MPVWPNGKTYPVDVWWEFGPRDPIWTPAGYTSSFHWGIDLGPGGGTRMVSPVAGTVTLSGWSDVFGNWVHVNDEFWLCHLQSRAVKAGDRVAEGQYLGEMGETGKANGRHLHFEYHPGGQDRGVDPRAFYAGTAASGGNKIGDDMSVQDIYDARDGDGRNMLDLGRQIRADLASVRQDLAAAARLNASADYPAFAAMQQRAYRYDVRQNGVGADWKLGPSVFELLNGAQAKSVTPEQVKQIADAVTAAVGRGDAEVDDETIREIANAVNDEAARRLAS